jgi:hypothetical protein
MHDRPGMGPMATTYIKSRSRLHRLVGEIFKRSSFAVATSREDHRSPMSKKCMSAQGVQKIMGYSKSNL